MRKCTSKTLCSDCPKRGACPVRVRRDKRARRPMSNSASTELVRRACAVLDTGWFSCLDLGVRLYGKPRAGRSARMSVMVRARRPLNRLIELGVAAARRNALGVTEYTVLPEWKEVLR